jgi:hypothetical protein
MLLMLFVWARALGPIRVKRLKQWMLAIARALMGRPSPPCCSINRAWACVRLAGSAAELRHDPELQALYLGE